MPHPQTQTSCPPDVLELLPWYPDDGLSAAERGAVEAHAAVCPECRRELHGSFRDVELPADAPSPERVLARVFERIAAGESAADVRAPAFQAPPSAPARIRTRPASPHRPRRGLRVRTVWTAAAGLALATLIGVGAGRLLGAGPSVYVTATAPPAARSAAGGPVLDVVLRGDASARALSEALQGIDGEIVAGPSELGRYQVQLPAGADASAAAAALSAEGTGVASFAVPLPH